ncbi:hypothetical protein GM528_12580 [Streptococcus pneumoniae]|nr:hypothetical protein [Streptococcus pneumoniae]
MVGKHTLFEAVLRYLFFLLIAAYSVTRLKYGWGWVFGIVVPIGIIGVMIRGLIRNFHKKQM